MSKRVKFTFFEELAEKLKAKTNKFKHSIRYTNRYLNNI